jgi:hypothetical protein
MTRLGDILLLAGRGSTSFFIAIDVLAGIALTVLSVIEIVHGNVGTAFALFFIGIPLATAVFYGVGLAVSVPLLWSGFKLSPDSRFVPDTY